MKWNELIEKISYKSRRTKLLAEYHEQIKKYTDMPNEEFIMDYVETTTRYEHKKIMLTVVTIVTVLSALVGIWKHFYDTIIRFIVTELYKQSNAIQTFEMISSILVFLTIVIVCLIIFDQTNVLKKTLKDKLLLEEVKILRNEEKRG